MQRKVIAGILLLTALLSLIAIIYSWINKIPINGVILYVLLFVIIPAIAGSGVWLKKKWGIILGLLYFVPQIINIQGTYEFIAPITLGITMGTNQTMLYINILAIVMTVLLVKQLKEGKGGNSSTSSLN